MFEPTVRDGVCRLASPGARWLATGWDGGYTTAGDAVNVTVPTGFERTDLAAYVGERRTRAAFDGTGPALLTGVDVAHARAARAGTVTVLATAGLSNPASLPVDEDTRERASAEHDDAAPPDGTVNLLVGTTRALDDGTLATLLATVVEAKTATLQAVTGFTGTTSDAVAVGSDPDGESADFAGSATAVGEATRACVRDAILASLAARYSSGAVPDDVATADHGTVTRRETTPVTL